MTRLGDALRKREGSPVGLRECDVGFAAGMAKCLLEAEESDTDVAACLEVSIKLLPQCVLS